ncbi:hypothetical protein D9M69_548440 [compost metagenome]
MRHHRLCKCYNIAKQFLACAIHSGQLIENQSLTSKTARDIDQLAKNFARFPPTVVAGIVAKTEEDRKRNTEQRECRAIIECWHPTRKSAMRPNHDER